MLGFSPTQMARGCWRSCELLTCPAKLTFVAVGYLDTLRSLQISAFFRRRWNDFQLRVFLVISWTLKINNRIMCKPLHAQLSSFVFCQRFWQMRLAHMPLFIVLSCNFLWPIRLVERFFHLFSTMLNAFALTIETRFWALMMFSNFIHIFVHQYRKLTSFFLCENRQTLLFKCLGSVRFILYFFESLLCSARLNLFD